MTVLTVFKIPICIDIAYVVVPIPEPVWGCQRIDYLQDFVLPFPQLGTRKCTQVFRLKHKPFQTEPSCWSLDRLAILF